MKKIIIAVLVVLAGFALWRFVGVEENTGKVTETTSTEVYTSDEYGISFAYPNLYYLNVQDNSTGERKQVDIILVEDTPENRAALNGETPGREGPTAITISLYQNNLDKLSAEQFVKNNVDSNYKLGNGTLVSTTKGILEGVEYTWSGLYEGKSFVVSRPDYVYMFSVTRLDSSDRILQDFDALVSSAVLN